jgi:DNA-binding CsgD family transcriptional regulator/transcriptional regulator with GAF, ATPase, and Fis domain
MISSVADLEVRLHRQITAALAGGAASEAVLVRITKAAKRLCRADLAAIALLAEHGGELEVVAVFGATALAPRSRVRVGSLLNGSSGRLRETISSTDALRDRRRLLRTVMGPSGVRGILGVPVRNGEGLEGLVGILGVAKRQVWRFSAGDKVRLNWLANCASIAVAQAQLRARLVRVRTGNWPVPAAAAVHRVWLSPRQREILHLLIRHHTCKSIASVLGMSRRTVEHHVERLKVQLHQPRLPALVAYAVKHHL